MEYILIIGASEAIFLILLLLGKRNKSLPDLFLGIMFFLYAISIGGTYIEIWNTRNHFPHPALINLSWMLLFLHGPALWFYITSLSEPRFRFKPVFLLHFVPFLFFFVSHYFTFIHLPAAEKIRLAENDLFKELVYYKVSVLAIGVSTITYNLWALRLIRLHRSNLMQNFSKIEYIDLAWLRTLVIASLISYSVNVALFNLDLIFHLATYKFLMFLTYSFASVYILVLGYFGLKQGNVFVDSPEKHRRLIDATARNKTPVAAENNGNSFVNSLLSTMEKRQPYLDPEITIFKLSELLNVKTDFLSEVLNSELHQNFFDFINGYRIAEFKNQSIQKTNSHLSIMGIAYNCGFNSKASFYRAFRKFEGTSPSVYIESVS